MKVVCNSTLTSRSRPRVLTLIAAMALSLAPGVASAQLSRVGGSTDVLVPPYTIGATDVGHDPVNDVYLAVGAGGTVIGAFLDGSGNVKSGTSQFRIGSAGQCDPVCGNSTRVRYSPDVNNGQGGFLVTWQQNDGVSHSSSMASSWPTRRRDLAGTRHVGYTQGGLVRRGPDRVLDDKPEIPGGLER